MIFMINVKKEFIENRIFERIESEIKGIDDSLGNVFREIEKIL